MPLSEKILSSAATNVGRDIDQCFRKFFRPEPIDGAFTVEIPGVEISMTELLVSSNSVVAVPWRYHGVHVDTFLGVPATGREVDLQGATFVLMKSENDNDWTYARYIDYLGMLHQLGVSTDTRPAFTPTDYEEVLKYMRS
jgi:hypothetical protein